MTRECFICVTCGMQFGPRTKSPHECPICNDERQYVRHEGADVDDDGEAAARAP